jgi:hypothetical protein
VIFDLCGIASNLRDAASRHGEVARGHAQIAAEPATARRSQRSCAVYLVYFRLLLDGWTAGLTGLQRLEGGGTADDEIGRGAACKGQDPRQLGSPPASFAADAHIWSRRRSCRAGAERMRVIPMRRRLDKCEAMFAASRGQQPDDLAANGSACDRISLHPALISPNITHDGPGNPGNVGL